MFTSRYGWSGPVPSCADFGDVLDVEIKVKNTTFVEPAVASTLSHAPKHVVGGPHCDTLQGFEIEPFLKSGRSES